MIRAACCASLGSNFPTTWKCASGTARRRLRYLVLPERPAGTEALTEDELAALVTRDSMIGVAKVLPRGEEAPHERRA